MKMFNKKAQTGGLITGIVFGVASLIIGVIIAFVIVSTLTGADLLEGSRTTSSIAGENGSYINNTGYQLANLDANFVPGTISITLAVNRTSGGTIPANNYTVSSTGVVTNTSVTFWDNASISYSSSVKSAEEVSTSALSGNFTAGVDNISTKIPTVLLVAAIVLILGVLALLVAVWQRMNIGGGSL